ncbi:MAG TPA: AMP-binding protein, partial [Thermomicrobiales bacterium]|nr:AMP-binding protein [Thermomicrobiales bacterium]
MSSPPAAGRRAVPDWLSRRRLLERDAIALVSGDGVWTWHALDRRVGAAAAALARIGVQPGARVALLAGNSADFVVVVHAIMRLGAVLVPLNTRLTAAELSWQIEDAGVALALHDAERTELALTAAGAVPCREVGTLLWDDDGDRLAAAETIDLDALQAIVYTSGTSGRPKGALLPASAWQHGACASALHLGHSLTDRWLAALPLFHVGGLAILFRSVIGGVPIVVHERFDPERMRAAFADDAITLVSLVPAMLPPL